VREKTKGAAKKTDAYTIFGDIFVSSGLVKMLVSFFSLISLFLSHGRHTWLVVRLVQKIRQICANKMYFRNIHPFRVNFDVVNIIVDTLLPAPY